MSSSSGCTKKLRIATAQGQLKLDLAREQVYARALDGTVVRVRHQRDLDPLRFGTDVTLVVLAAGRDTDQAALVAAFDDPSALPAGWCTTAHLAVPHVTSPLDTTLPGAIHTSGPAVTHQGGPGWRRDARSALAVATLSSLRGGDLAHETDAARSTRMRQLVFAAARHDPDWLESFLPFARSTGNIRTAAVHAAMDAAAAGHPNAARLIATTLQRADEPAVALQYWFDTYGRKLPASVRRGLSLGAQKLYTERNVTRFDTADRTRVSARDVIRLCHVKPSSPAQATLFGYLTASSPKRREELLAQLPMTKARHTLMAHDPQTRAAFFNAARERAAAHLQAGFPAAKGARFSTPFAAAGMDVADVVAWLPDESRPGYATARAAVAAARAEATRVHTELVRPARTAAKEATAARVAARSRAWAQLSTSQLGHAVRDACSQARDAHTALALAKRDRAAAVAAHAESPSDATRAALAAARSTELAAHLHWRSAERTVDVARAALHHELDARCAPESDAARLVLSELRTAESLFEDARTKVRTAEEAIPPTPAAVWEAMLPSMGYMQLLRNLRAIEAAGVSQTALEFAAAKIADADEVAASRQFPLRFWSAAKAVLVDDPDDEYGYGYTAPLASSSVFAPALERALDAVAQNIPELPGRTLVLVDQSGSMAAPYHGTRDNGSRTTGGAPTLAEVATLYGAALARRCDDVDVVAFGSSSVALGDAAHASVLDTVRTHGTAALGGTHTWSALASHYRDHDRIVVISDGQAHDSGTVPPGVPLHFFDLTGHDVSFVPDGTENVYTYAGLSDVSFRLLSLVEAAPGAPAELVGQLAVDDE